MDIWKEPALEQGPAVPHNAHTPGRDYGAFELLVPGKAARDNIEDSGL